LQTQLNLSSEDAAVIEGEVMEPYCQRFEKLQRYEEVFQEVWQKKNSLSDKDRRKLRRFQEVLGLRDDDVSAIETSEVGLGANRIYRFRAECQADVDKLSQILHIAVLSHVR